MLNFNFIFFPRGKSLRAVEIDFLKTVFCCSKLEDGPAYLCFGAKKNPNFLDKCWVFDLAQYTHSTELDMYFNYFKCLPDILWYVIIFLSEIILGHMQIYILPNTLLYNTKIYLIKNIFSVEGCFQVKKLHSIG